MASREVFKRSLIAAALLIPATYAAPSLVSQSAFTSPTTVSFNSIGNEVQITNQFAGQGVTFSGGIFGMTHPGDINLFPGPPTSIASDWLYSSGTVQTLPITITFSSIHTLVGFRNEVNTNDSTVVTTFLNGNPNGSVSLAGADSTTEFVGVSDPVGFNSITINITGTSNHFWAADALLFQGTGGVPPTTPISPSWLLTLLGLGGIGLFQSRERLRSLIDGHANKRLSES